MARLAIVICWFAVSGLAQAQKDSASKCPPPWFEVMFGLRSPAGLAGIGVGVPCGPRFTPAIAAGYGDPEGIHLSAGLEYRIARQGKLDFGAFTYGTNTTGYNNNTDQWDKYCTPGLMLKAGWNLILRAEAMELTLRVGYAGYLVAPVSHEPWGAHVNPGPGATTLEGGALLSVGMRFPLGRKAEGY